MKNRNLIFLNGLFFLVCVLVLNGCKKDDPDDKKQDPTTVIDVDGNVYQVKRICDKLWMLENLKTTRYNDSTVIPSGLNNADWGSTTNGAYSVYNDLPENNTTYGKLYNWYAANNTLLAPKGWHVATEAEWQELIACQGGTGAAGGNLKSTSTQWLTPNTGATNSSTFNVLPAGYRAISGNYDLIGEAAYFWGSNERNTTQGEYVLLRNESAAAAFNGATKQFGYVVRCIQD